MEVLMVTGQDETAAEITSREERGCIILGLNGGCDDACAEALGRTVDSLVSSGHTSLVLDLSRARYVESSGFRTILDRLTRLREMGGQLVVTGLHGTVGRAFKLLKLDRSVPTAEDVKSAVSILSDEQKKDLS